MTGYILYYTLNLHLNPLTKCDSCRIQVPAGRLNNRHYELEKCNQGEERRLRRKTLQHCFGESRLSFQTNAETLPPLEDFHT